MRHVNSDLRRAMAAVATTVNEHVKRADCMPFPSGPVIPRARSKEPPLLDLGLSAGKRAKVGLALLKGDYTATAERATASRQTRANPKSALSALTGDAAAEWASRHPEIAAPAARLSPLRPDELVLQMLLDLGQDPLAKDAIESFVERGKLRVSRGNSTPLLALPYAAPTYRCQCEECAGAGPVEQLADDAVAEALARPGNEWILLSQFFLRQLHNHLGWIPNRQAHEFSRDVYYGLVLRTLNAFARRREARSATAAGLVIALPKLAPYWRPAGAGIVVSRALPKCFWPDSLGDNDTACRQARNYLAVHGAMDTLVLQVDDLAREVASILTDPVVAPHIGLRMDHLTYMADRYAKKLSGLRAAARALAPEGSPAWPVDPQFLRRHLVSRVDRMRRYTDWMQRQGFATAVEATKASHSGAQPRLPPPDIQLSGAGEGVQ